MRKLIFLGLLFCTMATYAQDPFVPSGENLSPNVTIPNAPEAAALTKFGDQGASLFTGTPNISIPVGTISGREFSIPITLTYDASGIKVNQMATWVGLGWNLQAGGVINRVNIGNPDDAFDANFDYQPFYASSVDLKMNKFKEHILPYNANPDGDVLEYFQFKDDVVTGAYETQPDYYEFNAPGGLSGKFFIDYNNDTAICVNNATIKITPTITGNSVLNHKYLQDFTITDEHGNRFEFMKPQFNESDFTMILNTASGPQEIDQYLKFVSSWHLTKIVSAVKGDVIEFIYNDVPYIWTNPQKYGEINYIKNRISGVTAGPDEGGPRTKAKNFKIEQYYLKEIKINGTKRAEFLLSSQAREDLEGGKYLDEIKLYNNLGDLVTRLETDTDYFEDINAIDENQKRLRLKGVTQYDVGSNGTESSESKTHTFEYEGDGFIPDRWSYAQDYWGYYNGMNGNSHFVPRVQNDHFTLNGAIRDADLFDAKIGTLKRINYPTGGYTTFDYALHPVGKEFPSVTTWDPITQLTGGVDPNSTDPYGYFAFDDACFDVPLDSLGTFTIDYEDTPLRITSDFHPTGGTEPCNVAWSILVIFDPSVTPNLSEFRDNPNSRYFYQEQVQTIGNSQGEFSVDLAPGTYKYLLMSSSPHYTYYFDKAAGTNFIEQVIYGGGLRVDKIKNHDGDGNVLGYKRYYYDDYSNLNSVPNETDYKEASSGLLQEHLDYTELISESELIGCPCACDPGCGTGVSIANYLYLYRYSKNQTSRAKNAVTYDEVTEVNYSLDGSSQAINGYTVSEFYNEFTFVNKFHYRYDEFLSGELKKKSVYNKQNELLQTFETEYEVLIDDLNDEIYATNYTLYGNEDRYIVIYDTHSNGTTYERYYENYTGGYISECPDPSATGDVCTRSSAPPNGIPSSDIDKYYFGPQSFHHKNNFYINAYWKRPIKTTKRDYFDGDYIEKITNYYYDNNSHRQVTRVETSDSKGDLVKAQYTYPQDVVAGLTPEINTLISQNRLTELVKVSGEINGNTSETEMVYTTHNEVVLPQEVIQIKEGDATSNVYFDTYDDYGNVLQMSRKAGSSGSVTAQKTAYVWGYDHTYPVAKVDNLEYSQLFSGIPIINLAILNNDPTDQQVRDEIDKIRQAFPEALVTTYTHKPDIGVTSMTEPNGDVQYFEYDAPNRLVKVKDQDMNLVGSYEYNYKTN
ncbi:hypothetical protein POV27_13300 [Aureisphaera galaxeae]|uniref:hypothetical protein n=1 Tax=Aureisphaera galaxeae TaxID=1538023 RepID=UPI002350A43C|nr:hypothetical protein [Aureisphaera galaxeae]MDC8005032.1 hypothetical protein [Aureisphaera galaxeae]